MGCDIHIREQIKEDGTWVDLSGIDTYDGRNYELFAFLKDVRNYDSIKPYPLFEDRCGLPEDLINDDEYYYGDHNIFCCLASELANKEIYSQTITQTRLVSLDSYEIAKKDCGYDKDVMFRFIPKKLKRPIYPHCADASGPKLIKFTYKDWEDIKEEHQELIRNISDVNIWASWECNLKDLIDDDWFDYIGKLNELGEVRLIIGFDS